MRRVNVGKLVEMQRELDGYIIEKRELVISNEELIKNMFLAGYSELLEVFECLDDKEEWIDVLHFVLSISYKLGVEDEIDGYLNDYGTPPCNITKKALWYNLFAEYTSALDDYAGYKHWKDVNMNERGLTIHLAGCIETICVAVEQLGGNVKEEYTAKYNENIARQKRGY